MSFGIPFQTEDGNTHIVFPCLGDDSRCYELKVQEDENGNTSVVCATCLLLFQNMPEDDQTTLETYTVLKNNRLRTDPSQFHHLTGCFPKKCTDLRVLHRTLSNQLSKGRAFLNKKSNSCGKQSSSRNSMPCVFTSKDAPRLLQTDHKSHAVSSKNNKNQMPPFSKMVMENMYVEKEQRSGKRIFLRLKQEGDSYRISDGTFMKTPPPIIRSAHIQKKRTSVERERSAKLSVADSDECVEPPAKRTPARTMKSSVSNPASTTQCFPQSLTGQRPKSELRNLLNASDVPVRMPSRDDDCKTVKQFGQTPVAKNVNESSNVVSNSAKQDPVENETLHEVPASVPGDNQEINNLKSPGCYGVLDAYPVLSRKTIAAPNEVATVVDFKPGYGAQDFTHRALTFPACGFTQKEMTVSIDGLFVVLKFTKQTALPLEGEDTFHRQIRSQFHGPVDFSTVTAVVYQDQDSITVTAKAI